MSGGATGMHPAGIVAGGLTSFAREPAFRDTKVPGEESEEAALLRTPVDSALTLEAREACLSAARTESPPGRLSVHRSLRHRYRAEGSRILCILGGHLPTAWCARDDVSTGSQARFRAAVTFKLPTPIVG